MTIEGLIPARAGNTWPRQKTRAPARAHPRSRGEHVQTLDKLGDASGSSPLARGTLFQKVNEGRGVGLIPARAGNTSWSQSSSSSARAHPRSRGEHQVLEGVKV